MTREQQDTDRELTRAEYKWLLARGWQLEAGGRFSHPSAPKARDSYTVRDAVAMTRAESLRYCTRVPT